MIWMLFQVRVDALIFPFVFYKYLPFPGFVIAQWKKWHQLDCEESSVMKAIQDKLSGEHRKKELRLKRISPASKNAAQNTGDSAEK